MMVNTGGHTEGYMVYPKVNEGRREGKELMVQGYVSTNQWRTKKSYRDVVNGLDVRGSTSVSINIKDLHQPKTFMVNCMKRSMVVEAKDLTILHNLLTLVKEMMGVTIKITYMGDLFLLVVFESSNASKDFVAKRKSWEEWFMSVMIWSGQEIETGRLVWVKLRGVPFHLWDGGTFDEIGKSYGRLMVDSNSMLTKNNVVEGHFCVLTKLIHRIDEGEIRDSKEDSSDDLESDDLEPDVVRSPEVEKPIGMDNNNDHAGGNQTSGLHGWADFKTVEAREQLVAENELTQSVTNPNSLDHKSKSGLKNGSIFFLQNDGLNVHGAQEGVDGKNPFAKKVDGDKSSSNPFEGLGDKLTFRTRCLAYNPRSKRKFSSHSNASPISPSAMGGGKKMKGKSDSVETIQAQTDVVVNPYFMETTEVLGLFEGTNLPLELTGETMVQDSYGDPNLDVSVEEEVSDTINVGSVWVMRWKVLLKQLEVLHAFNISVMEAFPDKILAALLQNCKEEIKKWRNLVREKENGYQN
ncbi:hypothetical protein L1987_24762 [Smallanthus sonchifolius]|uniref:Uncharacterized protein n=1 Tax=Smallanthus sonchifolius TaxID=185202 RepID=A0ACB9IMU6_9ASTR|nr:hypothetical protein L1987_24762 [Smallanthus sonchifolius]